MPKLSALRLTKRLVEDAQPGSFISDSVLRGLGLRVTPAGAKAFVVSYRRPNGRQARQVIGSFPVDTVEQARTARDSYCDCLGELLPRRVRGLSPS
jgi:hypothetical protein